MKNSHVSFQFYCPCITPWLDLFNTNFQKCHLYPTLLNSQNSLTKVLALKDANQPIGGVINALGIMHLGLEAAVRQPLLQLLLMLAVVRWAELGVGDNKALDGELFGNDVHEVGNAV